MKKPWLVWILVLLHAAFAVACVYGGWVIWKASGEPNVVADGRDTLRGLYIGLGGCVGCALVYGLVALGLLKQRRWTWWMGVVVNGLFGVAIFSDMATDSNIDWEDFVPGVCFLAVAVLLLLPPVRRFIFKRDTGKDVNTVART